MSTWDENTLEGAFRSTQEKVLSAPMDKKTTGASSVGDFLRQCLLELWRGQDCFSGKRPLGSSGWSCDIAFALVRAGLLKGDIDEHDELVDYSEKDLDRLIKNAINYLFEVKK